MKRDSTTLAMASGKGGVGKSVIAANLAETLAAEGQRVALVDADFGQGACPVLLNEAPSAAVLDVALGRCRPEHALYETAAGLTLVQAVAEPGQAEGHEAALYAALDDILDRLRRTHTHLLIDAPAGADGPVRWALDRADMGALVLVGEPTAVADAYRLAKLVWGRDPHYPLGGVVNFADDAADARSVAERFGAITRRFTGRAPHLLGWVPFAAAVRHSVRDQVPAVRQAGPVRDAFAEMARAIVRGRHAAAVPAG